LKTIIYYLVFILISITTLTSCGSNSTISTNSNTPADEPDEKYYTVYEDAEDGLQGYLMLEKTDCERETSDSLRVIKGTFSPTTI